MGQKASTPQAGESKPQAAESKPQAVPIDEDDIVIVVIGPSGVGKSTFINTATGTPILKVNRGLQPCTTKVQHLRCTIPFEQGSRNLVFVDTPPFPDPNDVDGLAVEMMIREWSRQTFRKNIKVSGILYLHKINEKRMTQAPYLHYQMFTRLCGEGFHPRVLLVTTMWEKLKDKNVGEQNRQIIKQHYWNEMIATGSAVARHYGTQESARKVVRSLLEYPIIDGPIQ